MLAIGAGLPPNNLTGAVIYFFTIKVYALAVAFHVALLEIIREIQHGLVVRKQGVRFGIVEIVIPDAKQAMITGIFFSKGVVRKCSSAS